MTDLEALVVAAYVFADEYPVPARSGRPPATTDAELVALGAAAPYFYDGRRGRYAARLEALAKRARARKFGLWGACPHTRYDPYHGVETHR